jgi:hypothetical protein
VFEDRYRALVRDLLAEPEASRRRLGIVAIREGYEVGNHGMQSAHRIGCEAQLLVARELPDGRFDIVVGGRRRLVLEDIDTSGDYLLGAISYLEERPGRRCRRGRAAGARPPTPAGGRRSPRPGSPTFPISTEGSTPTTPLGLSFALSSAVVAHAAGASAARWRPTTAPPASPCSPACWATS